MINRLALSYISLFVIGQLMAQSWQQIGAQDLGKVNDIIEYNGSIYITGDFEEIDGNTVNNIARWDGTDWVSLGTGLTSFGYGKSLEVYNNELYVSGYFTEAGGNSALRIAKWNGTSWSAVLNGLDMMFIANDMHVINNVLYIAGSPDVTCNTPFVNIVSWDGSSFSTVGTGELRYTASSIVQGIVFSLAEESGELYVGGIFDSAAGLACEGVLRWDGSSWNAITTGLPTTQSLAIGFVNGSLICSQNNGSVHSLNGGSWTNYISSWTGSGTTNAILEFNATPIIAGSFNAGPHAYTGSWNELGAIAGVPQINALKNIGGELFAVGDHAVPDGNGGFVRKTLVAQWNGPVSVEENTQPNVSLYPNPARDQIIIELDQHGESNTARIYDALGQCVETKSLTSTQNVLGISELSAGVYTIVVHSKSGRKMLAFVKE